VCGRRRTGGGREGGGGREADGMQNQKQEPHTNMWGTLSSQRKTKKSTNSLQRVASLTDSEGSLGFVRQKRTVRLVTSHWETQQHSDDE